MDFGWALRELRAGRRVRRAGWNGKGMWIALAEAGDLLLTGGREWPEHWDNDGDNEVIRPAIVMYTADRAYQLGWLASQGDMLGEDWEGVDVREEVVGWVPPPDWARRGWVEVAADEPLVGVHVLTLTADGETQILYLDDDGDWYSAMTGSWRDCAPVVMWHDLPPLPPDPGDVERADDADDL